uniref:Uncharacterized protein n=1 Tax=Sphaerodactylus townsendi TaxID=933632 RepID=A0ACB8F8L2_9SAUR
MQLNRCGRSSDGIHRQQKRGPLSQPSSVDPASPGIAGDCVADVGPEGFSLSQLGCQVAKKGRQWSHQPLPAGWLQCRHTLSGVAWGKHSRDSSPNDGPGQASLASWEEEEQDMLLIVDDSPEFFPNRALQCTGQALCHFDVIFLLAFIIHLQVSVSLTELGELEYPPAQLLPCLLVIDRELGFG